MSNHLTTRNDFNPVHVMCLLQEGSLGIDEAYRILEEACHVIVKLQEQQERILDWQNAAPWSVKR